MNRFEFHFRSIGRVQKVVELAHPNVEEMSATIDDNVVWELIRRVNETSLDGLVALAKLLNRRERIATVLAYVVTDASETLRKLETVLRSVPRKEHIRPAWRMAVHHCARPRYLETMRSIAREVDAKFPEMRQGPHGLMLHRLGADDLRNYVIDEVERLGATLGDWIALEERRGLRIPQDSELARQLRLHLLVHGSAPLITRHDSESIRSWSMRFRESEFSDYAAHYLTVVSQTSWHEGIVDDIVARFGLPAAGHQFWSRVPEDVRLAVQRMVAARRLAQFFSGLWDPERRFAFWKEFLDHFTDISFPSSREHVFLAFGPFGVVEFRDSGNAGYFYRASDFSWIRGRIGMRNEYLKDQTKCFRRLIHSAGWQDEMRSDMMRYLRKVP